MKDAVKENEFPLGTALDFLQHLWELNHALERRSLMMERTIGVTAQQRLFIRCLGKYPGMTASQLAGVLHLDRGTVSTALTRLTSKGLVTGTRDAADKRRVELRLTAKGKAIDRPDPRSVEHAVDRLLARIGANDAHRVSTVLARLSDDLTKPLDRD
jgi:MarR family transcriptional regulator, organic hydroperoxide resistance regulator